jgi:hypothetical protein
MATRDDNSGSQRSAELRTITDAYDACTLGREVMGHLLALFVAIKRASDEHSQAHKLAAVGVYLTNDLGETFAAQAESMNTGPDFRSATLGGAQ